MRKAPWVMLLVGAAAAWLSATPCQARILWVETGSEAAEADGSLEAPFRMIATAMAAARPGDTVMVRQGVYRRPLRFPSGEPGKPITLRAAEGHRVVLNGREPIAGWRPVGEGLWATTLDWRPEHLFVGHRPQRLARRPREGWWLAPETRGAALVDTVNLRLLDGAAPAGGEAWVWLQKGNNFKAFAVEGLDAASGTLRLGGDAAALLSDGDRYWLQNRAEWIAEPGDWAVEPDADRFRVVFKPRHADDLSRVEAPRAGGAMILVRDARHVRIEGLEVTGSPRMGIEVHSAEDVQVRRCIVHGHGQTGVSFRDVRGGAIAENVVFGNQNGVSVSFSRDVTVERNDIGLNGIDGLLVTWNSENVLVRRNYAHHHLLWGHPDNVQLYRGVVGARFIDNLLVAGGQSVMMQETSRGEFLGNMIVGSGAYMLIFGHGSAGHYRIHGNTLASAGYGCMALSWEGYDVRENVIMTGHGSALYGTRGVSGYTADRNLLFNSTRAADWRVMATEAGWLKDIEAARLSTGQDEHSIQGDPKFRSAPVAFDALDHKRLHESTRDRWYLRRGGEMFQAGDVVEVNFDGVPRRVTAVADGAVTVDRPLSEKPVQCWLVANWGPLPGDAVLALDLRLADASPGATLAADGGPVGSRIDIQAFQRGDFDGDGARDLPELPDDLREAAQAWKPW